MTDFAHFFEQVGSTVDQVMGRDVSMTVLTVCAIAAGGIGLLVAVLGAKLWRFTLTAASVLVGVGLGAQVASSMGYTPLVGMGLGAVVLGVVGYKLFRLWVGVAAAALFAVIAGSAVGYNDVWPQLADYGPPPAVSAPSVAQASAASSGDAEDRGAALGQWWSQQGPALDQWARGFWDHAKTQNQNVGRNVTLSVLFAAIVGLGLGIFASRLTAVTITSVAGTLLLTGGATALVRAWRADVYNNAMNQPAMMGAALGIFLLASFSLQMLLTRSDKPAKSESAKSD